MAKYFRVIIVSILVLADATLGDSRLKHLLLSYKLAKMIGRSTMDYNGYGNYCGKGGSGPVLDPIDKSCREHDNCYHLISDKSGDTCKSINTDYSFGTDLFSLKLICYNTDFCKREVCECDTRLAECLQMNDIYYNPLMVNRKRGLKNVAFFFLGRN